MGSQRVRHNSETEQARIHRNGSMKIYSTLSKQINPCGTFQVFLTFHVLSITHPLSDAPSLGLCEHPAPSVPLCSSAVLAPDLHWFSPAPPLQATDFSLPTGSLGLSVPLTALFANDSQILPRQRPSSPQSRNQVARQLNFSEAFTPPAPTFPASAGDINSFLSHPVLAQAAVTNARDWTA